MGTPAWLGYKGNSAANSGSANGSAWLLQPLQHYWYIGSVLTALNGQVESPVSIPSCSFLLVEGLAKVLARWEPLLSVAVTWH